MASKLNPWLPGYSRLIKEAFRAVNNGFNYFAESRHFFAFLHISTGTG